jgi:hypothetical protein
MYLNSNSMQTNELKRIFCYSKNLKDFMIGSIKNEKYELITNCDWLVIGYKIEKYINYANN